MRTTANTAPSPLVALVQELLDAHLDTVEMALELEPTEPWLRHVQYLSALQREAKAILAFSDVC